MTRSFTCPRCGEPTQPGKAYFPFCSDRCKLIDLGKWANEEFAIPAQDSAPDEDELNVGDFDNRSRNSSKS